MDLARPGDLLLVLLCHRLRLNGVRTLNGVGPGDVLEYVNSFCPGFSGWPIGYDNAELTHPKVGIPEPFRIYRNEAFGDSICPVKRQTCNNREAVQFGILTYSRTSRRLSIKLQLWVNC